MGGQWDLNPQPPVPQTGALTVELRPPHPAPDRNRTCGPQLRRLLLYPAELQAHLRGEKI